MNKKIKKSCGKKFDVPQITSKYLKSLGLKFNALTCGVSVLKCGNVWFCDFCEEHNLVREGLFNG